MCHMTHCENRSCLKSIRNMALACISSKGSNTNYFSHRCTIAKYCCVCFVNDTEQLAACLHCTVGEIIKLGLLT